MGSKRQIPAVEGLFTLEPDGPRLIGGKCNSCGTYFFPKFYQLHKKDCKDKEVQEVLLSRRGQLVSYTVQYYPPPPPFVCPDPFVPYGIGMVALPEGINVLGILTGVAIEDLKMKMDVELVLEKLYEDKEGNEVLGWKFRPIF